MLWENSKRRTCCWIPAEDFWNTEHPVALIFVVIKCLFKQYLHLEQQNMSAYLFVWHGKISQSHFKGALYRNPQHL